MSYIVNCKVCGDTIMICTHRENALIYANEECDACGSEGATQVIRSVPGDGNEIVYDRQLGINKLYEGSN